MVRDDGKINSNWKLQVIELIQNHIFDFELIDFNMTELQESDSKI